MHEASLDPNPVIAILTSDIHLSHKPPVSRSVEEDWYEAMRRSLRQIRETQEKYTCPVIIAGDVFDDGWRAHKCPPSLINFALQELPNETYAIPGQHDLPNHRLDEIKRSGYWTLVEAGKIKDIDPDEPECIHSVQPMRLWGFPWGKEVKPCETSHDMYLEIAVIHSYIWVKGKGYPGAPKDKLASRWKERLKGYNVAVTGDNHIPFQVPKEKLGTELLNCGTLMRRRRDEKNFPVGIGLLRRDSTITRLQLDCEGDKWIDMKEEEPVTNEFDAQEFLTELSNLADTSVDFALSLERRMEDEKISEEVKYWILRSLEEKE